MQSTIPRWRIYISAILIIIAMLVTPLAITVDWAKRNVTSTEGFVTTLAPLSQETAVRDFVAKGAADSAQEQLGIQEFVDGIRESNPLLSLLPSGSELSELVNTAIKNAVQKIVATQSFDTLWVQSLTASHSRAIQVLAGENQNASLDEAGILTVQLNGVVAEVSSSLEARGFPALSTDTDLNWDIQVIQADALPTVQKVYQQIEKGALWMPVAVILVLLLAVLCAPRLAPRAFLWISIALGLSTLVVYSVLGAYFVKVLLAQIPSEAAMVIYRQITGGLVSSLLTATIIAALLAVVTKLLLMRNLKKLTS